MTRGGIVVLVLLAAAPAQAVDAPITAVTVFSDRARVTRSAVVTLTGRQQVALPLLGERVESGSIRLHSRNADVQTVDLRWVVGDEAFPRDEAREILAALDALDTEIARTRRDHGLHAGFDLLPLLDPAIPSLNAPRPAPKLGAGWLASRDRLRAQLVRKAAGPAAPAGGTAARAGRKAQRAGDARPAAGRRAPPGRLAGDAAR